MKLAGDYSFESSIQDVWDALFDPAVLAAVMPGCEKLELVDGSYLGEIKVKVGPIQGNFTGKVDLSDQVEPRSYKMVVDGRGAQGFVKATATIELEPDGTGTKVRYDSDAQIGGRIASVGQRLIETSARAIVKQSLEGLAENIKIRTAAHRAHAAAAPVAATPSPIAATPAAAAPAAPSVDAAEKPALAIVASPAVVPAAAPAVAAPKSAAVAAPKPAAPAAVINSVPAPTPAPTIAYKKADAGKLAGTVAKEVTKTLAPVLLVVGAALAVVIYLLVR